MIVSECAFKLVLLLNDTDIELRRLKVIPRSQTENIISYLISMQSNILVIFDS